MRVLSVVHQADAGPGVFAEAAEALGAELEEWMPPAAPPPADPAAFDAALVLGGSAHPDQEAKHPWLRGEKELIAALLEHGVPTLGVCLGAELVAQAAGGATRRLPAPEIGWYDVAVTAAGARDPLISGLPGRFAGFQWHSYACEPPPGAEVLAERDGRADAFRVGEAWAIQFHAEVTAEIVRGWLDHPDEDPEAVAAGFDPEPVRAETAERIGASNEAGRALFSGFLALAGR